MSAGREARRVLVSGRVQGVGFRWHTVEQAQALGLAGWVRNLPDGRVEAHLEGEAASLEAMLAWLREGPAWASVRAVDVRAAAAEGATGFAVRP